MPDETGNAREPGSEPTPLEAQAEAEQPKELARSTPEQVERAEALIRQMNVAKVRGQTAIADKLLQEAVETAPNCAVVQESLGDDFVARHQFRKAKEAYALAHKFDPENIGIENKFGEMVLKVDLMIDPFTLAAADSGTMASGRVAVVLSAMIPGLGQAVTGKWGKGIGFFVAWLTGIGIVVLLPGGFTSMFKAMFSTAADKDFNPMAFGGLILAVLAWLLAIADASAGAKRMTPRKVERPAPLMIDDIKKPRSDQ